MKFTKIVSLVPAIIPVFNVVLCLFSLYYWLFTDTAWITADQGVALFFATIVSFFFALPSIAVWVDLDL